MTFTAQLGPNAAAAADQAASRQVGDGNFPPVMRGGYPVRVLENKGIDEWTKNEASSNYGKTAVRLQVQVLDGPHQAANRHYFFRVPLFSEFGPTQENPEGSSAWMFWNFFIKVMGMTKEQILAGAPLPSNVEGKIFLARMSKPKAPNEHNPLGYNEIDDVDVFDGDFSKIPVRTPGLPVAPWLTPDDKPDLTHPVWQTLQAGGAAQGGAPAAGGIPSIGGGVPSLGGGVPSLGGGVPGLAPVTPIQQVQPAAVQPGVYVPPGAQPVAQPVAQPAGVYVPPGAQPVAPVTPGAAGLPAAAHQWGVTPEQAAAATYAQPGQPSQLQQLATGTEGY